MRLYDFSYYVKKRQEQRAAEAVAQAVVAIDRPGAIIELKQRVTAWMELRREQVRRLA